jgi:hypothetical protein
LFFISTCCFSNCGIRLVCVSLFMSVTMCFCADFIGNFYNLLLNFWVSRPIRGIVCCWERENVLFLSSLFSATFYYLLFRVFIWFSNNGVASSILPVLLDAAYIVVSRYYLEGASFPQTLFCVHSAAIKMPLMSTVDL